MDIFPSVLCACNGSNMYLSVLVIFRRFDLARQMLAPWRQTKSPGNGLMLSHHQDHCTVSVYLALVPAFDPAGSMLGRLPWPKLGVRTVALHPSSRTTKFVGLSPEPPVEFRCTARDIHLAFPIFIVRPVNHRDSVVTIVTILCHQVHSDVQQFAHLVLTLVMCVLTNIWQTFAMSCKSFCPGMRVSVRGCPRLCDLDTPGFPHLV